jgi:uncharacterized membrane protein
MWLGLLFYFNFVQMPALKAAQADGTAQGVIRHVVPRALFYFRWSSVITWLAGASLLGGNFGNAFLLRPGHVAIGIGAWLGTILFINVWVLIWPCQKKILGVVDSSEEDRNRARRVVFLTSRVNLMLAIPMVFFMAAGAHSAVFFN